MPILISLVLMPLIALFSADAAPPKSCESSLISLKTMLGKQVFRPVNDNASLKEQTPRRLLQLLGSTAPLSEKLKAIKVLAKKDLSDEIVVQELLKQVDLITTHLVARSFTAEEIPFLSTISDREKKSREFFRHDADAELLTKLLELLSGIDHFKTTDQAPKLTYLLNHLLEKVLSIQADITLAPLNQNQLPILEKLFLTTLLKMDLYSPLYAEQILSVAEHVGEKSDVFWYSTSVPRLILKHLPHDPIANAKILTRLKRIYSTHIIPEITIGIESKEDLVDLLDDNSAESLALELTQLLTHFANVDGEFSNLISTLWPIISIKDLKKSKSKYVLQFLNEVYTHTAEKLELMGDKLPESTKKIQKMTKLLEDAIES